VKQIEIYNFQEQGGKCL